MSLYDRILHLDERGINNHAFAVSCGEIVRGKLTVGAVADAFGLDAGERTELSDLVTRLQGVIPEPMDLTTFHELLLLGEARLGLYDTATGMKTRLGV